MSECKICSGDVQTVHFGESPIAGYRCADLQDSLSQPTIPLNFHFCPTCHFGFYTLLDEARPVLDRLYSNHFPTYHVTQEIENYHDSFIQKVKGLTEATAQPRILEIGCNSGHLLAKFAKNGFECRGIEPAKTFKDVWSELGIQVLNEYLTATNFDDVVQRIGKFDVVYFRHVLEHIEDPIQFTELAAKFLTPEGSLIIEVPSLELILERERYENVSYSHLNYFTAAAFQPIAAKLGLGLKEWSFVEMDGGALLLVLTRKASEPTKLPRTISFQHITEFKAGLDARRENVHAKLRRLGAKVNGFGAGAKGQHLIHLLNLEEFIANIYDDTIKLGEKYLPGTSIELKSSSAGVPPGALLNLAPSHIAQIRRRFESTHQLIDLI